MSNIFQPKVKNMLNENEKIRDCLFSVSFIGLNGKNSLLFLILDTVITFYTEYFLTFKVRCQILKMAISPSISLDNSLKRKESTI